MAEDIPKSKYSVGQLLNLDIEGEQYVALVLSQEWTAHIEESTFVPHWQYKMKLISWDETGENTFLRHLSTGPLSFSEDMLKPII